MNSQRPIGLLVFVHHNFSIISFVETFVYLQKIKKQTNKHKQNNRKISKLKEHNSAALAYKIKHAAGFLLFVCLFVCFCFVCLFVCCCFCCLTIRDFIKPVRPRKVFQFLNWLNYLVFFSIFHSISEELSICVLTIPFHIVYFVLQMMMTPILFILNHLQWMYFWR